ncbi:hypothetical protein HYT57_01175 [Candidatus Woesearchaeota archaeon]|nr:hypothetical protein [Candidatus Woesearchaeota archaeon]
MTNELSNCLHLEESLKDGYKKGRWYARHSSEKDTYCYVFKPDYPVLSLELNDSDQFPSISYCRKGDSISLARRPMSTLLDHFDKSPEYTRYLTRLGYLSSGQPEYMLYYFIGRPLEMAIMGEDLVDEIAFDFAKQIRKIELLKKTLNKTGFAKGLINNEKKLLKELVFKNSGGSLWEKGWHNLGG